MASRQVTLCVRVFVWHFIKVIPYTGQVFESETFLIAQRQQMSASRVDCCSRIPHLLASERASGWKEEKFRWCALVLFWTPPTP